MAANLEDELTDKVRALPPNKQQEKLRLLDTLASGASSEANGPAALADRTHRDTVRQLYPLSGQPLISVLEESRFDCRGRLV